jgi:hypothetical protein
MKFFKIVLALILAIGLVAGSTLTVMAKPEEKAKDQKPEKVKLEIQRGEVTSINATAESFVMKNGGKELTITTDNATNTTDNATKYFNDSARTPCGLAAGMNCPSYLLSQ